MLTQLLGTVLNHSEEVKYSNEKEVTEQVFAEFVTTTTPKRLMLERMLRPWMESVR